MLFFKKPRRYFMVKIAVIDDHQIVIDGVKALLQDSDKFRVALESTNAAQFLQSLNSNPVDIILTDIFMPHISGEELAKRVAEEFPQIHIIVLSMGGQINLVNKMITESNIKGFLLKNIGKAELVNALEKIYEGGVYFSQEILSAMISEEDLKTEQKAVNLTIRELEILRLIESEQNNKDIAAQLFISERTVETHRKNIYRKTNTNSIIGLIKYAYVNKIIP
jgi:DNA-binding NarL/FixJ family response regulator